MLYRTNSQSRQMEEALRRFGRKYTVLGGVSFYQRAEVKDLVAYLRTALSPSDAVSLLRIINTPARGVGRTTIETLQQLAAEEKISLWEALERAIDQKRLPARAHTALKQFRHLIERMRAKLETEPLNEVLIWVYDETGYRRTLEKDPTLESEGRIENINELLNAAADAAQRGETPQDFLDHAALVSEQDRIDDRAQILLMTLHNAKGLEFPVVAMIGMEETLFPHSRSIGDDNALEEERRLCYVGMTRAEQRLMLTCARTRRRYGGGSPERMAPSRFLSEIPPQLIDDRTVGGSEIFGLKPSEPRVRYAEAGMDLFGERHTVRQIAESRLAEARNRFNGETYDSADAIAQFFEKRGIVPPGGGGKKAAAGAKPQPRAPQNVYPPKQSKSKLQASPPRGSAPGELPRGARVRHAKYGVGTIVRREGDGDGAKVTILFAAHGLKKMIVKYAGLQPA